MHYTPTLYINPPPPQSSRRVGRRSSGNSIQSLPEEALQSTQEHSYTDEDDDDEDDDDGDVLMRKTGVTCLTKDTRLGALDEVSTDFSRLELKADHMNRYGELVGGNGGWSMGCDDGSDDVGVL